MANLGFIINSVGLGSLSRTGADIAVGDVGYERLYQVGDWGSQGQSWGPMLFGSAATTRENGHPMSNQDGSNNPFPGNLAGKYIQMTVEGSLSLTGELIRVEIKFFQDRGDAGFDKLYERTQRMNIRTICAGGISIEGTMHQIPFNRSLFNRVMRTGSLYSW